MSEPLHNVGAVALVARREISTRLASKAFRITTVLLVVGVIGFILALKLIGAGSGSMVGFTSSTAALSRPFSIFR